MESIHACGDEFNGGVFRALAELSESQNVKVRAKFLDRMVALGQSRSNMVARQCNDQAGRAFCEMLKEDNCIGGHTGRPAQEGLMSVERHFDGLIECTGSFENNLSLAAVRYDRAPSIY
eukprot:763940-Hanusia_phi.AAC.11